MRIIRCSCIALAALCFAFPSVALANPDPAPVNPGCDTDTSGWYSTGGSVSRDTTVYESAPASCAWTPGTLFYGTFTDYFAAGITYTVDFSFRGVYPAGSAGVAMADTRFGTSTGLVLADSSQWKHARLTWTPTFPQFKYLGFSNLRPGAGPAPSGLLVDNVALSQQVG